MASTGHDDGMTNTATTAHPRQSTIDGYNAKAEAIEARIHLQTNPEVVRSLRRSVADYRRTADSIARRGY